MPARCVHPPLPTVADHAPLAGISPGPLTFVDARIIPPLATVFIPLPLATAGADPALAWIVDYRPLAMACDADHFDMPMNAVIIEAGDDPRWAVTIDKHQDYVVIK